MEHQDFQHIVMMVRPRLTALCHRFFDCQGIAFDAEDAVQETLLRMWQMRDRLSGYRSHEALAMQIAKNVCIDILRHKDVRHDDIEATDEVVDTLQADQQAITHDMRQVIERAMAKLPGTQQRMITMRSEGMSMAEIAAACNTTEGSAKSLISAGRRKLMELLKMRRNQYD